MRTKNNGASWKREYNLNLPNMCSFNPLSARPPSSSSLRPPFRHISIMSISVDRYSSGSRGIRTQPSNESRVPSYRSIPPATQPRDGWFRSLTYSQRSMSQSPSLQSEHSGKYFSQRHALLYCADHIYPACPCGPPHYSLLDQSTYSDGVWSDRSSRALPGDRLYGT